MTLFRSKSSNNNNDDDIINNKNKLKRLSMFRSSTTTTSYYSSYDDCIYDKHNKLIFGSCSVKGIKHEINEDRIVNDELITGIYNIGG